MATQAGCQPSPIPAKLHNWERDPGSSGQELAELRSCHKGGIQQGPSVKPRPMVLLSLSWSLRQRAEKASEHQPCSCPWPVWERVSGHLPVHTGSKGARSCSSGAPHLLALPLSYEQCTNES